MILLLALLSCALHPIEKLQSRGVVVPDDFEPVQVFAVLASTGADPALLEPLNASSARVRAITGPALASAALESALAEQLGRASPRDTLVISLSMPLASGGEIAFLGADARVQGGRLRGALSLTHLEGLLLESAVGRVIVLVEPEGNPSDSVIAELDAGLARLARARAGVVALRVPPSASPLCVADLDGDSARSVGELSVALGGRSDVAASRAELPWAADRCGAPGLVTVCLFEDGAPVPPTHAFSSGAAVSFSVSSLPSGYVSVLSQPSGGPTTLLMPQPSDPPIAVGSNGEVRLPPGGEVLILSGESTAETLSLIWTPTPLLGLEALQSEARRARASEAPLTAQARTVERCARYTPVGDGVGWVISFNLTRQ